MARKRRKLKAVRLTDVPLEVRCRVAAKLAEQEVDPAARASLLAAAIKPSRNVYWVKAA